MRRFERSRGPLVLATVMATVAAALAGCSPGSADSSDGGPASVSLMIWDPAQKAGVQKAVDGFQAANPDIKVSLEQVPEDQYYTKLDASLGAGEGPDVMWQSSRAPVYVEGGALEPLDQYIEKDKVSMDAYPEKFVSLYKFDGKQYGIPKDQDVWSVVYNTAVFKKLGVTDVPTAGWTWEDMVRIAGEIKAKQTSSADVPMYYNYDFNRGVGSLIHALGGTVVKDGNGTVSSPQGLEAFEMIKDLQDKSLIPPVKDSADFKGTQSLLSGSIAMAKVPSWELSLLAQANVPAGTFHMVPQPSVNGSRATDTNGLSYVMNANSHQKDAAWKLIKYLTSDEGATLHAEGGASFPANVAAGVKAAYYQANSKIAGIQEAFDVTLEQNYLRTTTEFPKVRSVMPEIESTVAGPYYAGSLSASEAASKADAIITRSLKQ
ncbi:ABC transporter substrate-binding protein [Kribbella speibonae]|uniref:Sugar ABC transporter substrate-binding protein n=1 Tax=Kribbella speibonae TaxID=1572660 RepID=A0A4R0IXD5_9ACTN|nr:sugar ABC transporter substrate-binding protein [Kribbella speibonae]TCC36208.1 sugar ABC transporter substrate-binding protein [Kribbella speibonae]